jgi:hypothetical protein
LNKLTLRDVIYGLFLALALAMLFAGTYVIADFLAWAGYHQ